MSKIVLPEESYAMQGACFEDYKEKGSGFLETVYQECLSMEFGLRNIPVKAQPALSLSYKGKDLDQIYRPDVVCFDLIIVELKAVSGLLDEHRLSCSTI